AGLPVFLRAVVQVLPAVPEPGADLRRVTGDHQPALDVGPLVGGDTGAEVDDDRHRHAVGASVVHGDVGAYELLRLRHRGERDLAAARDRRRVGGRVLQLRRRNPGRAVGPGAALDLRAGRVGER